MTGKDNSRIEIIPAFNLNQIRRGFSQYYQECKLIVMGTCLKSQNSPDALKLTKEFPQLFDGPIIVFSVSDDFWKLQLESDCDYQADKFLASKKIKEILGT